jgi:hypothetical protein
LQRMTFARLFIFQGAPIMYRHVPPRLFFEVGAGADRMPAPPRLA